MYSVAPYHGIKQYHVNQIKLIKEIIPQLLPLPIIDKIRDFFNKNSFLQESITLRDEKFLIDYTVGYN